MGEYVSEKGYDYVFDSEKCKTCGGKCCIGESGYIWVTQEEQVIISQYSNIEIDELRQNYFRKYHNGYSVKDIKVNGKYCCVFFDLDSNKCSIYPARPRQCRDFPFWEHFKDKIPLLLEECPGIQCMKT